MNNKNVSSIPGHENEENKFEDLHPLRDPAFSEPVADLERLLSQNRRAFLIGAGCSKCAGMPLMNDLTQKVISQLPEDCLARTILKDLVGIYCSSGKCTIEDYMSELVDYISIAERRQAQSAGISTILLGNNEYSAQKLREALTAIKHEIENCLNENESKNISVHRNFVKSIHGGLQFGKSGTQYRVDYFTLNYDTLLEDALSLERIPIVDGFIGGTTAWWDIGVYDKKDAFARVFKVHGSIDWCALGDDLLPRRVRSGIDCKDVIEHVLIWPASTKYRETQRDPFAQIIEIMRKGLRPAKGQEIILTICGYAFNDEHINIELDRALHESEERLTVVAFTSDNEPKGQLREWITDVSVKNQIRIYGKRGFYHGDEVRESKNDLPWWKFEVFTRLLGGEK